jgi:DNA-binding SARP family transcriptional activator
MEPCFSPSGQASWGSPAETRASGPWGYGPDVAFTGSEAVMPTTAPTEQVRLKVDLLGRLDARTADDRHIRLPGRHSQALFALLVLARRPRSREAIAADLWPEADGTSAGSLRQALWLVRQGLAEAGFAAGEVLDIDTDTVGIRLDATIDLDVTSFEQCLANDACGAEAAMELYAGDLLEGLGHECFATERERLSDRYEDALAIVAERRLAAGDPVGARAAADRLLERDPLREEAHAVLIAVHGLIGSRSQVIRQYRRLEAILVRDLGEAPLPDTEATYRQALMRTIERAQQRASEIEPSRPPALLVVSR